MKLSMQAEFEVARPVEEVFDFATSCEGFPRFLFPLGPIPGVASARMVDAPMPATGARRDILMTDGATIEEVLLAYERPSRHRYRWLNRPAPPFSWLVRGGEGDWCFTAVAGGTRIVWVYHFELTSRLALVAAPPLMFFFRRWMQQGLERIPAALSASRGER